MIRRASKKKHAKGPSTQMNRDEFEALDLEMRVALIQQLIPIGLMAAAEELQREVEELAGDRYKRSGEQIHRFGSNPGTVRLGGQRVPIRVPRIRAVDGEIPLRSYELLHQINGTDNALLHRVLHGLSCRDHEPSLLKSNGSIGKSKSSVSREFVEASEECAKQLERRDLSSLDLVAVVIDGKWFAGDAMVVALGIDIQGKKRFLGLVQTDTENERAISDFLRSLEGRGMDVSKGILAILDGAKGLSQAVRNTWKSRVLIQRCQWHKRENVVSYLSKSDQGAMRKRLQRAYERPTYKEADEALQKLKKELEDSNQSAARSLEEGYEETLTLHRLEIFPLIGRSLKTTNCIESINSMLEGICGKVDRWSNSNQKHRWIATALLDIEPRLKRVKGCKHVPKLRERIIAALKLAPRT